MGTVFDKWWEQAQFQFVDEVSPLKSCKNCGKDIVSKWDFKKEVLLLHPDKSMCSSLVSDV